MKRRGAWVLLLLGLLVLASSRLPATGWIPLPDTLDGSLSSSLHLVGVLLLIYAGYVMVSSRILTDELSKRRRHELSYVLRLGAGTVALIAIVGALTGQWLGVLFSLGVVGFAITFAMQQPLFSLLGWIYIMTKRPYRIGDRVAIEGAKGDVIEVDFLVTTLWEINGELVSSNQPSGRIITVPNSVVLSTQVYNYSWEEFPYIWNEITIQVSYETDLEFARSTMIEIASDYLGDEMADNIETYRSVLAETPVELEVQKQPGVNIVQKESWIELKLRYLTHPRGGTRVKNHLYEEILSAFNDAPDRVSYPVGRNR